MRRFWQEIALVLAVKAVALAVLYFLFFAAPHPVPDFDSHLFAAGSRL